jgi:glycine hydroxymethyltransferase
VFVIPPGSVLEFEGMDLSQPQSSDLSLGLHSHGLPHAHAHARVHAVATPLRLFDDSEEVKSEGVGGGESEGNKDEVDGGDQHFSLLGQALCVKRPRRALNGGGGRGRRGVLLLIVVCGAAPC